MATVDDTNRSVLGTIRGNLVLIGLGSIGKGLLPLLARHFEYDRDRFHVIEPDPSVAATCATYGATHHAMALTRENHVTILDRFFAASDDGGFLVNVSVDVSSIDVIRYCQPRGIHYIDTVIDPWPGYYFNHSEPRAHTTNYVLRERLLEEKRKTPHSTTAITCCGANPGMVSWLVKQGLLDIARGLSGQPIAVPQTRLQWAGLMRHLGVKGLHISERDTQFSMDVRKADTFINTWSVSGFLAECFQPAELGWGTHEKWFPERASRFDFGCRASIYLEDPGGLVRVHTWTPTEGPHFGFLITHNESISIADYYTVGEPEAPEFRPTCHYAYHPCDQAVLSLFSTFGKGFLPTNLKILNASEIVSGHDELGVLLYGHPRNAYWIGSSLSIERTRELAPSQNATALQVTSALVAGIAWALENPAAGIVEPDEMDFAYCLRIQEPYIGPIVRAYTEWTPISTKWTQLVEDIDESDAWQFKNVLATTGGH